MPYFPGLLSFSIFYPALQSLSNLINFCSLSPFLFFCFLEGRRFSENNIKCTLEVSLCVSSQVTPYSASSGITRVCEWSCVQGMPTLRGVFLSGPSEYRHKNLFRKHLNVKWLCLLYPKSGPFLTNEMFLLPLAPRPGLSGVHILSRILALLSTPRQNNSQWHICIVQTF